MEKLLKYSKNSRLMNISISFGDEDFHFNLYEELIVDEDKINKEIREQASGYAFLAMLHKKLIRVAKDKKAEMEKTYAKKYVQYKSTIDPDTNRLYPKETAKEMATKSKAYNEVILEYNQAEENAGILEACVRSFEQRKDLIQTLSANIRKTG